MLRHIFFFSNTNGALNVENSVRYIVYSFGPQTSIYPIKYLQQEKHDMSLLLSLNPRFDFVSTAQSGHCNNKTKFSVLLLVKFKTFTIVNNTFVTPLCSLV